MKNNCNTYRLLRLKHRLHTRFVEVVRQPHIKYVAKEDITPIFIIGAGRSGNTLLARLLHETGGVHFGPENFTLKDTYLAYLNSLHHEWKESVDLVVSILTSQADFPRWSGLNVTALLNNLYNVESHSLGEIISSWYEMYGEAIAYPSKRWGCKTPNLTPHSREMLRVFPNAIFLYAIRDPYDVIESYINAGLEGYDDPKCVAKLISSRYNDYFRLKNIPGSRVFVINYDVLSRMQRGWWGLLLKLLDIKECGHAIEFDNPDTMYSHLRKVKSEVKRNSYASYSYNVNKYTYLKKDYERILRDAV